MPCIRDNSSNNKVGNNKKRRIDEKRKQQNNQYILYPGHQVNWKKGVEEGDRKGNE